MKRLNFKNFLIILLLIIGCNVNTEGPEPQVVDEEVKELINDLSNSNYTKRQNVSNILVQKGEEVVQPLIDSLYEEPYLNSTSESFNARWNKVNVLGRIGDSRAEDVLIDRIIYDQESHVEWRSIWALNNVKTESTIPKLKEFLKDNHTQWRASVVLGSFKDNSGLDILLSGLASKDEWVKWEAVYVLGTLQDYASAMDVVLLLKDKSDRIRGEATNTLGKLNNKEAIPYLIDALNDQDPGVRWRAASALAKLNAVSAINDIQNAMNIEENEDAIYYINKSLDNLRNN